MPGPLPSAIGPTGYLLVLVGGLAVAMWAVRRTCREMANRPPPHLPEDLEQATFREMRRYVIYQMMTCRRLSRNPHLGQEDRAVAAARAEALADCLKAHPLLDDLRRAIRVTEADVLSPLRTKLPIHEAPPRRDPSLRG